jgi:hypothetical protein
VRRAAEEIAQMCFCRKRRNVVLREKWTEKQKAWFVTKM